MTKLYEYLDILWEFRSLGDQPWVIPLCPVHRMELECNEYETFGLCEDCNKTYDWRPKNTEGVAEYLRRRFASKDYQNAEIISIDGIQTPQVKTRIKLQDENDNYWIEARVNESDKGRQIVLYAGEKGSSEKAQLFINADQEKLSFDHKDRKPEDIFTEIVATFPSGKSMTIQSAKKREKDE